MDYRIETMNDGIEYLLCEQGDHIHQMPLEAIASWGLLLGLTDPGEIVAAILRHRETPVAPGQPNVWTPLYAALDEGLTSMSAAGVPPEFMSDLLDPALGSPVPGPEVLGRMNAAHSVARADIASKPDDWGPIPPELTSALAEKSAAIGQARTAFVDELAPVFEVQQIAPQSVPEAMDVLNGAIVPGIVTL